MWSKSGSRPTQNDQKQIQNDCSTAVTTKTHKTALRRQEINSKRQSPTKKKHETCSQVCWCILVHLDFSLWTKKLNQRDKKFLNLWGPQPRNCKHLKCINVIRRNLRNLQALNRILTLVKTLKLRWTWRLTTCLFAVSSTQEENMEMMLRGSLQRLKYSTHTHNTVSQF